MTTSKGTDDTVVRIDAGQLSGVRTADGGYRWIASRITDAFDTNGNPYRAASWRDVDAEMRALTQRQGAQAALLAAADHAGADRGLPIADRLEAGARAVGIRDFRPDRVLELRLAAASGR